MAPDEKKNKKPTKAEIHKAESNGLAGTIKETLESDQSHFEDHDVDPLKAHGAYQQDDRDVRKDRARQKLDKEWIYMIRTKIPGGRLLADQYLAIDKLSRRFGNSTLRITSRQGVQFHDVKKQDIKPLIRQINEDGVTTLGGCGDVNRNTMSCPVADLDWRRSLGIHQLCEDIADHFTPQSTAYWEIWCDGVRQGIEVTPNREEPFYGKAYLPRKLKIAVAVPEDNCVDMLIQDIGVEIVHDSGRLLAYDVIIGGGVGFTHHKERTVRRLGQRLGRALPEQIIKVVEEIVAIQRDFGDRTDRKHARIKYLLEDHGMDWYKDELFKRLGYELPEAGPTPEYSALDHLGWNEAYDGSLMLGIHIESGRIQDGEQAAEMTGLREIVSRFKPEVRLTAQHNVILTHLRDADQPEIEKIMGDHGLRTLEDIAPLHRRVLACPAMPTCGLALAEAERYISNLLTDLEDLGWADAPVDIRLSGCPNSCVRTTVGEVGIVGKAPGKYVLFVGGSANGDRLGFPLNEKMDAADLAPSIAAMFSAWKQDTAYETPFGDWATERQKDALVGIIEAAAEKPATPIG